MRAMHLHVREFILWSYRCCVGCCNSHFATYSESNTTSHSHQHKLRPVSRTLFPFHRPQHAYHHIVSPLYLLYHHPSELSLALYARHPLNPLSNRLAPFPSSIASFALSLCVSGWLSQLFLSSFTQFSQNGTTTLPHHACRSATAAEAAKSRDSICALAHLIRGAGHLQFRLLCVSLRFPTAMPAPSCSLSVCHHRIAL